VIGEGIPYVSQAIIARHPDVTLLAALLGPVSPDHHVDQIDITSLQPGELRRWLRSHLTPLDAAALEVVSWEPARRLAPAQVARAEQETLEVVRNASAEIATIGSFGRRWLTNSVRNAILIDHRSSIPLPGTTATLATSGPSLGKLVAGGRGAFPGMLTVTSSAWSTLTAFDISPDMVVHTDGGFWAARYLQNRVHRGNGSQPVVAISAQAAIPDVIARSSDSLPFSMLATGWIGEQIHADFEDWLPVAEGPTVTATALHLLHGLAPQGRFCLAGLDLMSKGVLNHARPHPNDRLIATWANRLRPECSIRAQRILGPNVTSETWTDGVIGYRSPALRAFIPEIDRIVALHRATGSVVSLGERASNGEEADWGASVQEARTGMYEQATPALQPRSSVSNQQQRPPRPERIAHARRMLNTWRDAAVGGSWDTDQREILFHLAPVEVLRALRGELDAEEAAASARSTLDTLDHVAERISAG
jgi:hypothetical protein